MSVTLTNAEKQARYGERHLGVDGEKVRVGLVIRPALYVIPTTLPTSIAC